MKDRKEELTLTNNQRVVFDAFKKFIITDKQKIFILNGYAGTGKTTLIRLFIEELRRQKEQAVALASTGRASKILTNAINNEHTVATYENQSNDEAKKDERVVASTVHSLIYGDVNFNQDLDKIVRQEDQYGVDKSGQLLLIFHLKTISKSTTTRIFYIIDEASMISDVKDKNPLQARFGSGRLLKDLFEYNKNGKFIFVGDEAQLPPVGQDISPALSPTYIKEMFNMDSVAYSLNEIVRQKRDSGIVNSSYCVRKMYADPPQQKWVKIPLGNHADIKLHYDILSMINEYINKIRDNNYQKATFISSTNRKCGEVNTLIRSSLGRGARLEVGDLLLVTQNNRLSGLMNGDMVVVKQIKDACYQRAQLTFLLVEVCELVTGRNYTQLLIEDILYSQYPNLTQIQQKSLFIDFYRRMKAKGLKQSDPSFKHHLENDDYLNALRCVFGYAVTCHKSQGGEWDEVYVDIPRELMHRPKKTAFQWLYTAITRAKRRLHVVNDFYISG